MRQAPLATGWLHPLGPHTSSVQAIPSAHVVSPTQCPWPSQRSTGEHGLPSSHAVVAAAGVHARWSTLGAHARHGSPALGPAGTHCPSMMHLPAAT